MDFEKDILRKQNNSEYNCFNYSATHLKQIYFLIMVTVQVREYIFATCPFLYTLLKQTKVNNQALRLWQAAGPSAASTLICIVQT